MDWIKKHADQFALAMLALGLIGVSSMLMLRTQSFSETFATATAPFTPSHKVPPVVLDQIEKAKEALKNPPQWNEAESIAVGDPPVKKRGSLFISDFYVIGDKGEPEPPGVGAKNADSLTKKLIPNSWFSKYKLSPFDAGVALLDSDKDGFANEDEWRDGTDPTDKESHPAYHTKLFVKQFIRVAFRLEFKGYDGEPGRDKPDKFSFQINTLDLRQPSEFLKLGEKVANTPFKLLKFEYKTKLNPSTGEKDDISELTLTNLVTTEEVVLILNRVTDSPDFYMDFYYKWPNPQTEFRVKKRQEFVLKPDIKGKYKLVDSQEGKAVIETPDGKKIEILPDPRR